MENKNLSNLLSEYQSQDELKQTENKQNDNIYIAFSSCDGNYSNKDFCEDCFWGWLCCGC